jgi:hypothetical protein
MLVAAWNKSFIEMNTRNSSYDSVLEDLSYLLYIIGGDTESI